jgi:hypothetical protein
MEFYFSLNQDIIIDLKLKKHPKVIFLSVALPAKSKSVYPCNITSPSPRYHIPYSIGPLKNLSTCFVATKCSYLNSTMN